MRFKKPKSGPLLIPYIVGGVILLICIIFMVKGLLSPAPAVTPGKTELPSPTVHTTVPPASSPSPTQTPSPSPTPESSYTTIRMSSEDIFRGNLILINGDNAYRFSDSDKNVCLYNYKSDAYKVGDFTIYLAERIIPSLNNMMNDFYAATGVNAALVCSGLRTYDYQQGLFDKELIARNGDAELASHWVASPGHSEHHSGLALDFAVYYDDGSYYEYDGSGDFQWINSNCQKYGFIVRYQEAKKDITGIYFEPWHFRYIGIPHAVKCTELGLCFEEYSSYLRRFSSSSPLTITTDGGVYETYFCEGLTVEVPKTGDYEISGNNIDGFIVTVKVS